MIRQLMCYLHGKGIDSAYLAVSVSNESAIRAYKKTGFITVKDHNFARVLKTISRITFYSWLEKIYADIRKKKLL